MVEKTTKKRLPTRYPRDGEILIFSELSELDYRMSDIDGYFDELIKMPDDEDYDLNLVSSNFSALLHFLKKAFIELERFFQNESWTFETDLEFVDDLKSVSNFKWRLSDLKDGRLIDVPARVVNRPDGTTLTIPPRLSRLYEPATHACAEAIYIVLFLSEIHCESTLIKDFKIELKYWLTRYYAAALEISLGRSNVFTSGGRKLGAISAIKKYMKALYDMQADGLNAKNFHKIIKDECSSRTVSCIKSITITKYIDNIDSIEYTENNKTKKVKLDTITENYGLLFPKGK